MLRVLFEGAKTSQFARIWLCRSDLLKVPVGILHKIFGIFFPLHKISKSRETDFSWGLFHRAHTRFRCRNCTCNCGRRHNFFVKKLSLLWREEKMHEWTKQCRISDENALFIFIFYVVDVFQKLLFIYFLVEAGWLRKHIKGYLSIRFFWKFRERDNFVRTRLWNCG